MHGQFDINYKLDKSVVVYQLELVYHIPPKRDYLHDLDPPHERIDDFGTDLRLAGRSGGMHGRSDPAPDYDDDDDDDDESQHDKHDLVSLDDGANDNDYIGNRVDHNGELLVEVAVQLGEPVRDRGHQLVQHNQQPHKHYSELDADYDGHDSLVQLEHSQLGNDVKLEQIHCERRRRRRTDFVIVDDDLVFLVFVSFDSELNEHVVSCDDDRAFRPDR
ncbi:uncharacterized protein JCM10292_000037 [Rhodotorula paludigena]|uniref:uncharacterized protein n=1 Tax=Rhodotorula paludigena TaxID=86838 RepID=UPI0031704BB0